MVAAWVLAVSAVILAGSADGDRPRGGDEGKEAARRALLSPGDTFVVDVAFSNAWEAAGVAVATPRGPGAPLGPAELEALRRASPGRAAPPRAPTPHGVGPGGGSPTPEVRLIPVPVPTPPSRDPLFVDLRLEASVASDGSVVVVPKVSRVHYYDDRGRNWTIRPSEASAAGRAGGILKACASSWRADLADWPEREMLEEQVLGAALALLHESSLTVDPAAVAADGPAVGGLAEVLDARLPEGLPAPLREKVAGLCCDLVRRVFSPVPAADLAARGRIEVEQGSYQVEKVRRSGTSILVTGERSDDGKGRRFRETLEIDRRTGLVTESASIAIRDSTRGGAAWVGYERWTTKLRSAKVRR